MKIYFLTTNKYKIDEAKDYLSQSGNADKIDLKIVEQNVDEILDPDLYTIVRRKTIAAFEIIRMPCLVEHGGLFVNALPGLFGGIGQLVWNAVGDRMCCFVHDDPSRAAFARSFLGYCDGRRVRVYMGETRGRIADGARGSYAVAWDPVFIPEGSEKTYGEMGLEGKRATSPVFKAWDNFIKGDEYRPPGGLNPRKV